MVFRQTIGRIRTLYARLKHTRLRDQRYDYQLQEIATLKRAIDAFSIDCFFDVGANQGQYAQLLRKNVGFRGTIISAEPNPEQFAALERVSRSDAKWHSYNIALADHDGEQLLSVMAGHQFTSLSEPIVTETTRLSALNSVTKRI